MALRERNSALHWAATRPEGNTPAVAVAVGHFVQVGIASGMVSGWAITRPRSGIHHAESLQTTGHAGSSPQADLRGYLYA